MKQSLLFFFLLASIVYGTSSNASEELDMGWDVICNTMEATDIKCVATVQQITPGANYQYCWGSACSPWVSTNNALQEIVTMAPQESNSSFHVKYRHYGNAGQSIVRFCWSDVNNTTNIFCYDLTFCVDVEGNCIVAVDEVKSTASIARIAPNPSNDLAVLSYEFSARPNNAQLVIYNVLGELVDSFSVSQRAGQLSVSTKELQNGIYFCSIMLDGKKMETKRLVVHH
jgi:Secretion system C-terminal sorting domain